MSKLLLERVRVAADKLAEVMVQQIYRGVLSESERLVLVEADQCLRAIHDKLEDKERRICRVCGRPEDKCVCTTTGA